MLITNQIYKNTLVNYASKDSKLSNEVKKGHLIKIKNGLYETDSNTPPHYLAGCIYGPSYISFDFALAYYGLIPERVESITCATFDKKKKKKYANSFGDFLYRDVPTKVYSYGIRLIEENGYSYQIAIPEKALCDKLYTLSPVKNLNELQFLLFNDLRIDEE